jgi:hypothetical protein
MVDAVLQSLRWMLGSQQRDWKRTVCPQSQLMLYVQHAWCCAGRSDGVSRAEMRVLHRVTNGSRAAGRALLHTSGRTTLYVLSWGGSVRGVLPCSLGAHVGAPLETQVRHQGAAGAAVFCTYLKYGESCKIVIPLQHLTGQLTGQLIGPLSTHRRDRARSRPDPLLLTCHMWSSAVRDVIASEYLAGPLGTHNKGRVGYEDQALVLLACHTWSSADGAVAPSRPTGPLGSIWAGLDMKARPYSC